MVQLELGRHPFHDDRKGTPIVATQFKTKYVFKDPNGHSWEFFSIKQHLDPVHTLELDAFYMDMYEVTVGQFNKLFVQESGCKLQAVGYRA